MVGSSQFTPPSVTGTETRVAGAIDGTPFDGVDPSNDAGGGAAGNTPAGRPTAPDGVAKGVGKDRRSPRAGVDNEGLDPIDSLTDGPPSPTGVGIEGRALARVSLPRFAASKSGRNSTIDAIERAGDCPRTSASCGPTRRKTMAS
jgi:hypothetical protein